MILLGLAILFSFAGAERAVCIPLSFACIALSREFLWCATQSLYKGTSRSIRTFAKPVVWLTTAAAATWAFTHGLDSIEPFILDIYWQYALCALCSSGIDLAQAKNMEHMVYIVGDEDEKAMSRRFEHGSETQVFHIVMVGAFLGACGIWAKHLPDECEICVGSGEVEVLLLPPTFAELEAPRAERELRDFVCWNCEGEGEVPDAEEAWSEAAKRRWNYDAARRGYAPAQFYMGKSLLGSSDRPLTKECEAWYLLLPPEMLETPAPNTIYSDNLRWNKPRFSPFIPGPDGERGREARARAMELQAEILSNLKPLPAA